MEKEEKKRKILNQVMSSDEFPEKVPLYLNLQGWIVYHTAGYGYSEAVYNSENILDSYKKATELFPADMYYDMGGYASMFLSRCLGSEDYYLNDEKYSLNFKDISYLQDEEEYKMLADHPEEYLWNNFYMKKFKNLTGEQFKNTISEYLSLTNEHFQNSNKLKKELKKDSGAFFLSDVPIYQPAFDYLFQYIVGMRGISLDMRRKKKALLEALDSFEKLFNGYMDKFTPYPDSSESPFQSQICLLGQTITNPKQFDQFIWPHLSEKIKTFSELGHKFYFMVEGACGPLREHLNELPDGCCALHAEKDSLEELVEQYGEKFIYVGGMPVSLLGSGTLDEVRNYTQNILEKYGHNGNFIFSTDKGIVFERDATVDNLKAMCEIVNEFKP